MTLYLVVILSTLFVTSSGNIFSAFAPMSALRSFSPFSGFPSFGSSFSNFPFGQTYGSSYTSDDPFNSAFTLASSPFQNSFSPSPTPQPASPFGGRFSSGAFPFAPFPSFPAMPSFPSFNSFTNGLKGNGFKVTSTSSEGKDGTSGQVIVQVEKIGDEKKPGEQRRVVQTFRTAGPLIPSNQMKGKAQNKADRQRVVNKQPMKTNNQKVHLPNGAVNQQRKPSFAKPMKPASPTNISPLNDLLVNGTTSQQQSVVSTSNKPILQEKNNNQLIKTNGATVSSSKTSSSLSIPSTSQNIVNGNGSSFSSGNSKVISNTNSQSKSYNGVTVKRVDSSGRITTGFIQP